MQDAFNIDDPSAPSWFRDALRRPGQSLCFEMDGRRRHLLTWDWANTDKPAILLVHGYLAHANWWGPIAAQLVDHWRIAAMDLSGMGDSDGGPHPSALQMATDVLDALAFLRLPAATVVGHSYGGSRALRASGIRPGAIRHLVLLDSYINPPGQMPPQGPPLGGSKTFAAPEDAVSRFRFRPRDVEIPEFVKRHVVRTGLRPAAGGWSWKFTPGLRVEDEPNGIDMLRATRAQRVDFVRGGDSGLVSPQHARWMEREMTHTDFRLHEFPGGHHHFLLQDPVRTAALLRELLAR